MIIRRFRPGWESLGLVADFVAAEPPFGDFRSKKLLAAIRHQLSSGQHAAGFEGDQLVAYCGWLLTSLAAGQAWLEGKGDLIAVAEARADSAALTIVRIPLRANVLPMIRACRNQNPGKRIFFNRNYTENGAATKKSTVLNRVSGGTSHKVHA